MCGIAGVYHLGGRACSEGVLKSMAEAIKHRGPDGQGFFNDRSFSVAHQRLSILDTSERGSQPMISKDGRWTIAFNGCIYNFRELRGQLESRGAHFISTSDTEVIVEGIAMHGIDFIKQLDGMFAVVAWDSRHEHVYLCRDRFGVKPLYYYFNGNELIFSSEIKGILAHPSYTTALNKNALNEYFTFQNLFSHQSLFKGIWLLPPANIVKVDKNSTEVKHHSFWDYDFSSPDNSMTFEDAVTETSSMFQKAVEKQMVSDVPVGAFLSGGMDSGAISSIASQHIPRLSTFTCGFDMSSITGVEANYDERRDAELMANAFKTEHYEQVINAGDIRWSLPRVVYHLEELRVGMSYPNYYISRLASKFVKVCLQGTGGDELFGGYPWRYYRIFDSVSKDNYLKRYFDFWQRLVSEDDKSALFNFKIDADERMRPRQVFENVFNFNNDLKYETPRDLIQNSLYFEIKTFLPGLLMVGDKLSMSNSLEERFPFLDNNLVNLAQKIPIEHKLKNLNSEIKRIEENAGGQIKKRMSYQLYDDGKSVFRDAMMEFLPKSILNRQKQGFSAPDESWYRGENAQYVKDLLLKKDPVSAEFINRDFISKIVDEHINKGVNHRLLIWSFMSFEWWCRIFLNGEKIPD